MPTTATLRPMPASTKPAKATTAAPTVPRPTFGPTATPLKHVVKKNETLLGIASQYGVSLDALITANPGVNPRFLSIGQSLVIPGADGAPITSLFPTPTPIPVRLSEVSCYRTPSDSLWCLVTAANPTDAPLEGLSALITLVSEDGQILVSAMAYAPIDLVSAGLPVVLAAFVPPPAPDYGRAEAFLDSAVPVGQGEGRYVNLELTSVEKKPGMDRKIWNVAGGVALAEGSPAGMLRIAVLIMGLDSQNRVVGYSQREMEADLQPGIEIPFEATVFTLGPEITSVEILTQGKPLSETEG